MTTEALAEAPEPANRVGLRRALVLRDYGIIGVLILLIVLLAATSRTFLTAANLSAVLDQAAVPGIAACGVTLAIVSGAFDLSLGSVYAVGGIVSVMVARKAGTALGDLGAVASGATLGAINGAIIAGLGINSFIATLATSFAFGGIAIALTSGVFVTTGAAHFGILGTLTPIGGMSVATWVFFGVALLTGVVLHSTGYGRTLFAIGGNREAARLSGIRVRLNQVIALGLSGTCAAIAGVIDASRTAAASSSSGSTATLALTAIAGTIIGGTSILGGDGAIWRAVVGVLILGLMADAFNLLGINGNVQEIVEGMLILAAVGADIALRRRA